VTLQFHTRMPFYVMACATVGVTLLSVTWRSIGVPIVINPTVSEPMGFYRIVNHAAPEYRRGMVVVFPVPTPFQSFVYGRGWLKAGVPLMKNIGALAGDQVCVREDHFEVNGKNLGPVSTGRDVEPGVGTGTGHTTGGSVPGITRYPYP